MRGNNSGRSEGEVSVGSSLSTREVGGIKRWMIDKDKEDRRKNIIINIIIKEIKIPRKVGNDRKKDINWATDLIKEKLYVDAKVVGCRESGYSSSSDENGERRRKEESDA